jgi:hypothetical protein
MMAKSSSSRWVAKAVMSARPGSGKYVVRSAETGRITALTKIPTTQRRQDAIMRLAKKAR